MRRPLAMLKYVPAVLCGLLLVAWVASNFVAISLLYPWYSHDDYGGYFFSLDRGSFILTHDREVRIPLELSTLKPGTTSFIKGKTQLGAMGYVGLFREELREYSLPLALLLTLLIPPAAVCVTHFRVPLWSYFAWTALIAAELAYYLR